MKKRSLILAAIGTLSFGGIAALHAQEAPQLPGQKDASRITGGSYSTDPAHTLVQWNVSHFGFNDYFGLFGDIEGTLVLDPANPAAAQVDITVPIADVTVASEGLRNHLLRPGSDGGDPDFFGPAPAPARFTSTMVHPFSPTEAVIMGNLTMNGVTRPVSILAEFTGAGANPMSSVETVGFHGKTTITRSEFGVDYAVPFVSDEVELTISAAFEKD